MLKCIYELRKNDIFRLENEDKWYRVYEVISKTVPPAPERPPAKITRLQLTTKKEMSLPCLTRVDVMNAKLTAILDRTNTDPNDFSLLIELNRHDY